MEIEIGQSLAAGAVVAADRCTPPEPTSEVSYNGCRSALAQAQAELRNDEILLSRQARELARQASLIGALESALASLRQPELTEVSPCSTAGPASPDNQVDTGRIDEHAAGHLDLGQEQRGNPQKLVVLPTVYTNVGSLLDVFA